MTPNKNAQFLISVINLTKRDQLSWEYLRDWSNFENADRGKSFSAVFGNGRIALIRTYSDVTRCFVRTDIIPDQQVGPDNFSVAIRLYNIVASKTPNIELFMDWLIATEQSLHP